MVFSSALHILLIPRKTIVKAEGSKDYLLRFHEKKSFEQDLVFTHKDQLRFSYQNSSEKVKICFLLATK